MCYWCWAEINMHTLWSNFVFIMCQFAMLNVFPHHASIKKALTKCEAYHFVTNRQKYAILLHMVSRTSQTRGTCKRRNRIEMQNVMFSLICYKPAEWFVNTFHIGCWYISCSPDSTGLFKFHGWEIKGWPIFITGVVNKHTTIRM